MRSLFRAALCAVALASFSASGSLLAHEGHEHDAPVVAVISNLAPRAEAASELYELVAIARAGDTANAAMARPNCVAGRSPRSCPSRHASRATW